MKKLLMVMVLGASAVAASAQGLQPRRTSGGHLQRQKMLAKAAQRQETVDGFTWSYRVSNGEATIMKLEKGHESCAVSPTPKGHFTIPSTLGGAKVTGIGGYAFVFCAEMTSVTLPDAVKEIGWSAFLACGLTSVKIPEGVTSIGNQAFYGCGKLTSVTIPASVESIGWGVFGWCLQLKQINLADGNQRFTVVDGVLYTKDLSELIMCPNTLTSVKIPSKVSKIGMMSFEGCEGLVSLTIPEWVTNIGEQAFRGCRELASVTMLGERPASLNNIFDRCGKLKAIHVPAKCKSWAGMRKWQKLPLVFDGAKTNVKIEGDGATQGMGIIAPKLRTCEFLLNKDFKKNAKFYLCLFSASWCPPCRREMPRIAKTYAETLKDDPDIELIHFSCDQNDEKALAWAKEHEVKFPVVKPKGGNPLDLHSRGIPHLFIVKADGTLVEEGHPMRIFNEEKFRELKKGDLAVCAKPQNESNAVRAAAGEHTESVDGYTWSYRVNNGEVEIVMPKGSRWGRRTAVWPKPTGHLSIPSTLGGLRVTKIGRFSFADCKGIASVTIPASVTDVTCAFAQCDGLRSFEVDSDNPSFSSREGFLCSKDGSVLVAGVNGEVKIPSCVTTIADEAFWQCEALVSVEIPPSVQSIGDRVFSDCFKLSRFSVDPENPSFSSRDGLLCSKDGTILVAGVTGNVKIPSCVTKIGDGAFAGRIELASVEIPTSVKSIGRSAFFWCSKNLASVTIPASVTYVDPSAFTWCYKLSRIMIEGDNACYRSIDGVLYNKAGTELIICPEGKTDALTIPDGVTNVRGKFHRVTSVTIPASVKTINPRAFVDGYNLTSVTMLGERPGAEWKLIDKGGGRKLAVIHVPANAKSWAGMKEWQGIPLAFDAESQK